MNLTNIAVTSIHKAFEEVKESAEKYDITVTGSELIGLIPLKALTDAGKYYFGKMQMTGNPNEAELVNRAVQELGLNELKPFNPNERIIEYFIHS